MSPIPRQKLQPRIVLKDIFKNNKGNISKRKNIITAVNTSRSRFPTGMDKNWMNPANNSQRTRSTPRNRTNQDVILIDGINDANPGNEDVILIDDNTNIAKPSIPRKRKMTKDVVSRKKRGRPRGSKNHKLVDTNVQKKNAILQANTSQCARCTPRKLDTKDVTLNDGIADENRRTEDVILIDDKTDIPKPLINCEAERTEITQVAASTKSRGRPRVEKEKIVNAILKNKGYLLRADGLLVNEHDRAWVNVKQELENKVAVSTIYRVAKEDDVYALLIGEEQKPDVPCETSSEDQKDSVACIPIVDKAEGAEPTSNSNTAGAVYEHVLFNLVKAVDSLTKEIKEFRKDMRDNTAQMRKSSS